MPLFETVVSLLLVAALLLQISRRLRAPYPTMLALAGAAVAAFPWAPQVGIDPHLALALFVAPAILNTAYDTSPIELRRNWLPLTALALFAVLLTSAAVAWAGWAYAGLPLAAAIALGAIVAPPDTAAASAVLGSLGIPRRTMTILQGESLLNDAVALLIFGAAVAAAGGGASLAGVAPRLLLAAPGGVLLGLLIGSLYLKLWPIWSGTLSATIIDFVGTFAIWLLAERIGVSPVLAIVAFAMRVARSGPERQRPRDRLHSFSVWDAVVFVLNVLAFLLMGLQARAILERLQGAALWHALAFAAMVFAIVVLVRLAWVMSYRIVLKPLAVRLQDGSESAGSPRLRLLVAWCGMRGILTLATALSLPADFPGRDVIVLAAFGVVLGTLIIQGSTIALLIRWLGIPSDTSLEDDIAAARRRLAQAGLAALEGRAGLVAHEGRAGAPGRQHDALLEALRSRAQGQGEPDLQTSADAMQLAVVQAQRRELIALHHVGAIAEDAFRVLQQELDWRELSLAPSTAREIAEA